ncbi:hypothetical protein JCM1840_002019 [Sporobolomyces johnsonii]
MRQPSLKSAKSGLDLHTTGAFLLLAAVLCAYTAQTELASYVQHELRYKKPYFLFYLTHSGYCLLLPCHCIALGLLRHTLLPSSIDDTFHSATTPSQPFSLSLSTPWIVTLARKVALLTLFISFPALSWYAAVPLTSMADLTAIYNVFAFWAYLFSIRFLPTESISTPLQARLKLISVVLAVLGVFVIAYGDGISGGGKKDEPEGTNRLLGNGLALFGSIAYAGYEVWYKLFIALPESSSSSSAASTEGADDDDETPSESSSLLSTPRPLSPSPTPANTSFPPPPSPSPSLTNSSLTSHSSLTLVPPAVSPTLFLLYSNLITSLIGLATLLFLWIPIPILDYVGWEEWDGPPPREVWAPLVGIIAGGVVFNGCFMLLISLWGPVVASVANLLTLILVAVSDALFVPSAPPLTTSSLIGGGMIVCAFAGLIWGEYGYGAGTTTTTTDAGGSKRESGPRERELT